MQLSTNRLTRLRNLYRNILGVTGITGVPLIVSEVIELNVLILLLELSAKVDLLYCLVQSNSIN